MKNVDVRKMLDMFANENYLHTVDRIQQFTINRTGDKTTLNMIVSSVINKQDEIYLADISEFDIFDKIREKWYRASGISEIEYQACMQPKITKPSENLVIFDTNGSILYGTDLFLENKLPKIVLVTDYFSYGMHSTEFRGETCIRIDIPSSHKIKCAIRRYPRFIDAMVDVVCKSTVDPAPLYADIHDDAPDIAYTTIMNILYKAEIDIGYAQVSFEYIQNDSAIRVRVRRSEYTADVNMHEYASMPDFEKFSKRLKGVYIYDTKYGLIFDYTKMLRCDTPKLILVNESTGNNPYCIAYDCTDGKNIINRYYNSLALAVYNEVYRKRHE